MHHVPEKARTSESGGRAPAPWTAAVCRRLRFGRENARSRASLENLHGPKARTGTGRRSVGCARRAQRAAAFTLLEVVLAIVIAIGILVVALYFYQQASSFRSQLLDESERVSSVRLLMDKITSELRTAQSVASFRRPLTGESNAIEFIRADVPSLAEWKGGQLSRAVTPETDLKLVRYRLLSADETNVLGLMRSEQPLVDLRTVVMEGGVVETNRSTNLNPALLTSTIRFVQFRYWNGNLWQETWNAAGLPSAVEVSLGAEPAPPEIEGETNGYPAEVFRRTIYLPTGGAAGNSLFPDKSSATNGPASTESEASMTEGP